MKDFLRKVSAWMLRPLRGGGSFFVFLYLLLLLVLVPAWGVAASVTKVNGWTFVEAFADAYVWAWLLTFFPARFRHVMQGVSVGLLGLASVVDCFVKVHFQSFINPAMLRLVMDTRSDETWSFFTSYVFQPSTLLILLPFVAWGVAWGGYVHFYRQWSRRCKWFPSQWRVRLVGMLLLVGGLGMIPVKVRTVQVLASHTLSDLEVRYGDSDWFSLYSPLHRIGLSARSLQLADRQLVGLRQTQEHLQANRATDAVPKVVVIIGESYNRSHSQLYGYPLETTPLQQELVEEGSLFPFTDVVSCWNLTSYVFQNLMSLHSVDSQRPWETYPLFPAVYKKTGYQVAFFTSQFPMQAAESVSAFAGSFFMNDGVLNRQLFDVRNASVPLPVDDVHLLEMYDTMQVHPSHELIVFSLIGMHFNYDDRIPSDAWKTFSEKDYMKKGLKLEDRQILADYDNATRYNDYLVREIIRRFEKEKAVVVYCPDHGEELFDGTGVWGRTYPDVLSDAEMHNQFEIPFWVWCSESLRASDSELVQRIESAQQQPFMSDDLPHLLMDLTGVRCPDYQESRSPLSPSYHAGRKRILRGWQEYKK